MFINFSQFVCCRSDKCVKNPMFCHFKSKVSVKNNLFCTLKLKRLPNILLFFSFTLIFLLKRHKI